MLSRMKTNSANSKDNIESKKNYPQTRTAKSRLAFTEDNKALRNLLSKNILLEDYMTKLKITSIV